MKNKMTKMETTEKNFKAFIAGTRWSVPFDYGLRENQINGNRSRKEKNSHDTGRTATFGVRMSRKRSIGNIIINN